MDIFMDRLAQRLTAQDIIQANTAADTEEMNKLKAQIAEYHQCLEQLGRLLDEETAKLKSSRADGENVNRLVEEGIAKIRAIQLDSQGTGELQKQLSGQLNQMGGRLDAMEQQMGGKLDTMEQQVGGKLGTMGQQMEQKLGALEQEVGGKLDTMGQQMEEKLEQKLGALQKQVGGRLDTMGQQMGEALGKLERQAGEPQEPEDSKLAEKFATLEENVHKECVKVYRNVQAVVVEEGGKQSEAVTGTLSAVDKMKGRTGAILGISIVALIASLGSVVLQLLQLAGKF